MHTIYVKSQISANMNSPTCLPEKDDLSLKFVRNFRNINSLLFYINIMNWLQYVGDYSHSGGKNKIAILKRDRLIYYISIRDKKIKLEGLNWIP